MNHRAPNHDPWFAWHVALVAGVLAVPGVLLGAITGLFLGAPGSGACIGGLIGAMVGAALEAWRPRNPSD
jgi:hypothetical protein